jgi:uncharacterized protein (DUF1330 family)
MGVYLIFIRESTSDQSALATYMQQAPGTLSGFPVKVHVFGGHHEALEGPSPETVIIIEFPTVEAAKEWYESPAYQAARQVRLKGTEYRVILVEGVPAGS